MAPDGHSRARQQFGAHASSYRSSGIHAQGRSLARLLDLTGPQPDWRVLDVATGAGHTARTFAQQTAFVVASDVTYQMLATARDHLRGEGHHNAALCLHDAEHLPYPTASFDLVTCRLAAHHFPNPLGFVQEAARILKPGGLLAIADNIVSGEPEVARFINTFEKLRDPSHNWAYSLDDWETFFFSAGLHVEHSEMLEKAMDFDGWAARQGVTGDRLTRLRTLLEQTPAAPREWLQPERIGQRLIFRFTEGIVVGRKA